MLYNNEYTGKMRDRVASMKTITDCITNLQEKLRKIPTKKLYRVLAEIGRRGSSVSIVSGYGLDDWAIEVRSPAKAKDFMINTIKSTKICNL
jgi:hypothetical protein